jgi:hypothetical protein
MPEHGDVGEWEVGSAWQRRLIKTVKTYSLAGAAAGGGQVSATSPKWQTGVAPMTVDVGDEEVLVASSRWLKQMKGGILSVVTAMSKSNCPWGRERSRLIGVSALCYAAPAVTDWMGGNPRFVVWVIQAVACFWSDYIDSGQCLFLC